MNRAKPPLPSLAGLWGILWRATLFLPVWICLIAVVLTALACTITALATEQWLLAALGGSVIAIFFLALRLTRHRRAQSTREEKERASTPGEYFI